MFIHPYPKYASLAGVRLSFNIRGFRPEDLDRVVMINRSTLPENYPPDFFLFHYRENPRAFMVAEVNGEVVGYIMCRVERAFQGFKKGVMKKGHIISIAVLPHARGRGIGRELLRLGLQALKEYEADEAYLEVRVSNKVAINLYKSMGFTVAKRVPAYYADGEDAYLMVKPLK
ncbi:MAG: ribosomal protein S18-alanine N-acetyltransferase [Candidatus Nezhaarchaeales archaeon]